MPSPKQTSSFVHKVNSCSIETVSFISSGTELASHSFIKENTSVSVIFMDYSSFIVHLNNHLVIRESHIRSFDFVSNHFR